MVKNIFIFQAAGKMLSELTNIDSLNDEMFFLKQIKLYSCNINIRFLKKTKRISSVPDSNRYTREFSL